MLLSFEISMPNIGSWNGQWTGAKDLHFMFMNIPKGQANVILKDKEERNYYYNFGDGWGANIKVKQIDSKTKKMIERKNSGFMGYDWMVDSIIQNNKIIAN